MIYPGYKAFELKATHGVPFEIVFDRLLNNGVVIDWKMFIECARRNGWWDFQTYQAVEEGLADAGVELTTAAEIMVRIRLYITTHKHPGMQDG